MTTVRTVTPPKAALIAASLIGIAGAIAFAVVIAGADAARAWLRFPFPTPPRDVAEAVSVFLNNARMLGALLLATYVAQSASSITGAARLWGGAMRLLCDAALIVATGTHVLLIGAGLGAYGSRMVAALLPHGPLELAAYSLALALYVSARTRRVAARHWVRTTAAALLLLALAAPLEVFVVL